MRRVALAMALLLGTTPLGCQKSSGDATQPSASAAASSIASAPDLRAIRSRLLSAEHRRDSAAVTDDDLQHSDPAVRRWATRALSRILDERARKSLVARLADEDAQVLRWAAYGLGFSCQGHQTEFVPRLALRAASWSAVQQTPDASETLTALAAIAGALARCGGNEAEATLRAWLEQSHLTEIAALALGKQAHYQRRLDDVSMVALLEVSAQSDAKVESALYAFTQLSALSPTVRERLLDVAGKNLKHQGTRRSYAIRALGNAGPPAAGVLQQLLVDSKNTPQHRIAAVYALGRIGEEGQHALQEALEHLIPIATKNPSSEQFGVLAAAVDNVVLPITRAKQALRTLSELPLPQQAPKTEVRRRVRLRCKAAALLAGPASAAQRLLECDPAEQSVERELARLSALDRGPLAGARGRAFERLVDSETPRVAQAALSLLAGHAETKGAHQMLSQALKSKHPGRIATAARVLAAYPERGAQAPGSEDAHPHAEIIKAFADTLESNTFKGSVEVTAALMDAAGALELLSSKPALERYCKSDQPTLREHAERALLKLGDTKASCDTFTPPKSAAPEVARAATLTKPVTLEFQTELGKLSLSLDPTWAPVAVARVLDLVAAGHFSNMPVHRVVPGFVVQFGDDTGDGFGHAGRPPIRCETAPVAFEPYHVGMALAGRDTAASQMFVTLERYPRLDGNYAWVGRAGPEWARLVEGDRILSASVRP